MRHGFLRVAMGSPKVALGDVQTNTERTLAMMRELDKQEVAVAVFPERGLVGATLGDLVRQDLVLRRCEEALEELLAATETLALVAVVGLPLRVEQHVYNVLAVLQRGKLLALVPQRDVSGEAGRWFTPGPKTVRTVSAAGASEVPFGHPLRFVAGTLSMVLCFGDVLDSPRGLAEAMAQGNFLACATALPQRIGLHRQMEETLRTLTRGRAGMALVSAGEGESTTEAVFSGLQMAAEDGRILAKNCSGARQGFLFADWDSDRLVCEAAETAWPTIPLTLRPQWQGDALLARPVSAFPFVPSVSADLADIRSIQAQGLKQRLEHLQTKNVFLGVSGGLDSTLALLVAVEAFQAAGWPREGIIGVGMPAFGTSGRTRSNARALVEALGITYREISLEAVLRQHFADIGLPEGNRSVAYENAQARERTQILMDLANLEGGLVVGTGDLSESALGWTTYNGDHMSMYNVNAAIPKTLVRALVRDVAERANADLRAVLLDILATPVSPELLPPAEGQIAQKTEEMVGPYELQDFFLYHVLRSGTTPSKLWRLAWTAFSKTYSKEEMLRWMRVFYRRFIQQQFKRNCSPEGPAVGEWSLSPRGGWVMPSDVQTRLWLEELDSLLEVKEQL